MSLDINTPRGQATLADEQKIVDWLHGKGVQYVQTPKDKAAKVDAVLLKDGYIFAVAETKCRYNLTLDKLQNRFANEWLITEAKVQDGIRIAIGLCVPLVGFLYLVDDDTLLAINLLNAKRRVAETMTQQTVNGGHVVRLNAYVLMDTAKVYRNISPNKGETNGS
jgi:hypothetical protein